MPEAWEIPECNGGRIWGWGGITLANWLAFLCIKAEGKVESKELVAVQQHKYGRCEWHIKYQDCQQWHPHQLQQGHCHHQPQHQSKAIWSPILVLAEQRWHCKCCVIELLWEHITWHKIAMGEAGYLSPHRQGGIAVPDQWLGTALSGHG